MAGPQLLVYLAVLFAPCLGDNVPSSAGKIRASVLPALLPESGSTEDIQAVVLPALLESGSAEDIQAVVLPELLESGSDFDDVYHQDIDTGFNELYVDYSSYDIRYDDIVREDAALTDAELNQFMRALDYYEDLGVLTDENGDDLSEEEKVDLVLEILASNDVVAFSGEENGNLDYTEIVDSEGLPEDHLDDGDEDVHHDLQVDMEVDPVVGDIDLPSLYTADLEYDYQIRRFEDDMQIVQEYLAQDPELADFLLHYDEYDVEDNEDKVDKKDKKDKQDKEDKGDNLSDEKKDSSEESGSSEGQSGESDENNYGLFDDENVFEAGYERPEDQETGGQQRSDGGQQMSVYFRSLGKDFRVVEIAFYLGSFMGVMLITFGLVLGFIRLLRVGSGTVHPSQVQDNDRVKNVKLSGIVKSYARLPVEIRNMKPSSVAYKELYNNPV